MSSPDETRPSLELSGSPDDPGVEHGSAMFRLLVESVRDYAIFLLDPEGRVLSWNHGAERIHGYAADEIIGRRYDVFFEPESRERGEPAARLEATARKGWSESEGWRRRKDGSRLWAHVVLTALYDDGELVGFGKVVADKTAERSAKQDLLQREQELEEAQQIAHLGSWTFEIGSGEVHWSDELFRIFGLAPSDVMGYERYLKLLHPEDADRVRRKVERALEAGEEYVHEHRIQRPSGETRWVQSRGEVIRDAGGEPIRMWISRLTSGGRKKWSRERVGRSR